MIQSDNRMQPEAQTFLLPHLESEGTRLLLATQAPAAILLPPEPQAPLPTFPLLPAAATVFLALLRASPAPCSYASLFAALYPCAAESFSHEPALGLRPIRYAVKTLRPVAAALGLRVVALRGWGYLLTQIPPGERAKPLLRLVQQEGQGS